MGTQPPAEYPSPIRARRIVFGALNVLLAPVWTYAAYRVFKHILHLEFVAIMSLAMSGSMGQGGPQANGTSSGPLIDVAVIEGTARLWFAMMRVVGVLMVLSGVISLLARRRGRGWLLASGFAVIAATVCTLAGMWVLIRWGGFPPTVTALGYLVIASVQSAYGWVLLGAFFRKPKAARTTPELTFS